ncbi:MAG: hypothetical protein M1834_002859 [Cirrosporium novae-zelandiae]|nr:MAG: hypothetical protein M1834_002859 [Cirrosporium novae-zelandiae]
MFQSFTGSSRRPRQVNLSGRKPNPFAASPSSKTTLAQAQQERLHRQQERERLNSTKQLQRVWRGSQCRGQVREEWRRKWDKQEETRSGNEPRSYQTREDCEASLRLLLLFFKKQSPDDLRRLRWFLSSASKTSGILESVENATAILWLRLAKLALEVLKTETDTDVPFTELLLFLIGMSNQIPKQLALYSEDYYSAMAHMLHQLNHSSDQNATNIVFKCVLALLESITANTFLAYEGFAQKLLTRPDLANNPIQLEELAAGLNYKILASATASLLRSGSTALLTYFPNEDSRLWLLSYCVYFHNHAYRGSGATRKVEPDQLAVISLLLSSVADTIVTRMRLAGGLESQMRMSQSVRSKPVDPLPEFVKNQVGSLIDKDSITSLLSQLGCAGLPGAGVNAEDDQTSEEPKLLASYALTLLRVFPKRADDLRLWLFMSSTSSEASLSNSNQSRLPAVKYFSKAIQKTHVYQAIKRDSRKAIELLKHDNPPEQQHTEDRNMERRDQDWQIIILFLELYTFVLRLTDDEEFFSPAVPQTFPTTSARISRTRESALPLEDVKGLTIFLKNLAFTLYWNSSDILGDEEIKESNSLGSYFSMSTEPQVHQEESQPRPHLKIIAGIVGMSLDYLKGLVTGLLRAIYERDSRRRFLPEDHWLMTSRFDMEGFIPRVVEEEENTHQIHEADDEEPDYYDDSDEDEQDTEIEFVGTGRIQQIRQNERLQRKQRRDSRKRYLQAVAPRLEILQNMPFFIPFATRVEIFREFVTLDQLRRRGGTLDPDQWRMSVMHGPPGRTPYNVLDKHHAKIRRGSVFEDAFEQFYSLGEELKEPIQISFVDKFDTLEAGIDGGGVTKEFLTSVTSEAFNPSSGLTFFIENDQNLLYPNPTAIDQRKELLRDVGIQEGTPSWNEEIRNLLKRYEFLGRIIGKCLYEGILVDLHFAGFFLLKWSLTGGSGSASKESGYRANLNDLRELDKGLYQGLLQLKDYSGNVEDFSLNFTVTDVISEDDGSNSSKKITRDLVPNGSNIPVTNENRLIYISEMAKHRLQRQPYLQTSAFLRGLSGIIQPSWLSMFNQAELQTLVGGASTEINVEDLRRNTQYGGIYVIGDDKLEHPTVQLFWQAMHSFSDADRRKVLKFVTSTPRAPLLGFSQLYPHFSIRDSGSDETRLPSTSTCVNLLKLPRYSTFEILQQKLLYSINSNAGFDLS